MYRQMVLLTLQVSLLLYFNGINECNQKNHCVKLVKPKAHRKYRLLRIQHNTAEEVVVVA